MMSSFSNSSRSSSSSSSSSITNTRRKRDRKWDHPFVVSIATKRWIAQMILVFLVGIFVGRQSVQETCNDGNNGNNSNSNNSISNNHAALVKETSKRMTMIGSIQHLDDIPIRPTKHTDQYGRPITKQTFLESGQVPFLTGFSIARLTPGQILELHHHETMHELFYILQGTALVTTTTTTTTTSRILPNDSSNSKIHPNSESSNLQSGHSTTKSADTTIPVTHNANVTVGTLLHVAPHETHGFVVPEKSSNGDLIMIMIGIAPD